MNCPPEFSHPYLDEADAQQLKAIIQQKLKSLRSSDLTEPKEWLLQEFKKDLPHLSNAELTAMVEETRKSFDRNAEYLDSLRAAKLQGVSNDEWSARALKRAGADFTLNQQGEYLQQIEATLLDGNTEMYNAVLTKNGLPNMNPNLDGFLAEQLHAASFNMNATAKGEGCVAEVLTPSTGELYAKNSFDIIVKDAAGVKLQQYQAKFGATAKDTIALINRGNYNNQRIIVPTEQVQEVQKAFPNKTITDRIGGTNNVAVASTPLSKEDVKKCQEMVQRGKLDGISLDWNEIAVIDLAKGIGKQAAFAGLTSAALGAGADVTVKLFHGEDIYADEVIKIALENGTDAGIKYAVAGSIKIASEKGFIKVIPKGTPMGAIANIVHIGIENLKIMGSIVNGEFSVMEGLEKMEEITVGMVVGIVCAGEGLMIGAVAGAVIGGIFGPVGMAIGFAVGACVGTVVGYSAGETFGRGVTRVFQKVRSAAFTLCKATVAAGVRVVRGAMEFASNVRSRIGEGISNFFSIFA